MHSEAVAIAPAISMTSTVKRVNLSWPTSVLVPFAGPQLRRPAAFAAAVAGPHQRLVLGQIAKSIEITALRRAVVKISGLSIGTRVDDTKPANMLNQLISRIAWAAPFRP